MEGFFSAAYAVTALYAAVSLSEKYFYGPAETFNILMDAIEDCDLGDSIFQTALARIIRNFVFLASGLIWLLFYRDGTFPVDTVISVVWCLMCLCLVVQMPRPVDEPMYWWQASLMVILMAWLSGFVMPANVTLEVRGITVPTDFFLFGLAAVLLCVRYRLRLRAQLYPEAYGLVA
jgi:hypothetical protein